MNLTKHWAATLDDYAIDLAWSPDGTQLAAASAAGPVSLFAAGDGAKRHTLPGHEGGTNCLAFAPNFQMLATGGQDGAVKFWDAVAGQHTATTALGNAWVEHLAWRPTQRPEDRSQKPASDSASLNSDLQPTTSSVLFAATGKKLTALRTDGSVAHTFKPAPKTIIALAAQPAGGCVAAAHFGGVQLWDADDFLLQKELPYANGIHALVWSPDSKWLISGNQDPSVHLWIPADNIELHMSGYEGKVKELSFDPTSRWLASGGGHDACIWDCAGAGPEGREPFMFPHDAKVCAVAFQNAHSLLATAAGDGTVMIWSVDRRQPLRATVKMPAAATKLAWSPDDTLLAIGAENGAVYVLRCVT
ncbi:MAG: WD40 repeat domain-containing protein [Verrucomicrobiota bacterium]